MNLFFGSLKIRPNTTRVCIALGLRPWDVHTRVMTSVGLSYQKIYFHYLLRLKQQVTDNILEILPFLLAETVRYAIGAKLKNHLLPLHLPKTQVLLTGMVFRELFGYETS